MSVRFADSEEVYRTLGWALKDVVEGPGAAVAASNIECIIGVQLKEPDASLAISMMQASQEVVYGGSLASCDVILSGDSDTVQGVFLGDVNLFLAISESTLLLIGPKSTTFVKLVPSIQRTVSPVYRRRLARLGVIDLPLDDGVPPAMYSTAHPEPRGEPYGGG